MGKASAALVFLIKHVNAQFKSSLASTHIVRSFFWLTVTMSGHGVLLFCPSFSTGNNRSTSSKTEASSIMLMSVSIDDWQAGRFLLVSPYILEQGHHGCLILPASRIGLNQFGRHEIGRTVSIA